MRTERDTTDIAPRLVRIDRRHKGTGQCMTGRPSQTRCLGCDVSPNHDRYALGALVSAYMHLGDPRHTGDRLERSRRKNKEDEDRSPLILPPFDLGQVSGPP